MDLSDEAYYAIFLDDWMKEGLARSPFLTLHQVSALFVYPAALAYRAIRGSSVGIILFLRCLYLLGSVIAALAIVPFLRRAGMGPLRWMVAAVVVAFVPYGLPAPSYNTIAAQAFIVACAAFASAVLAAEHQKRTLGYLAGSAAAWALAVVAYPSLILPLPVLLACVVFVLRPGRRFTLTYLSALAAAHLTAGALVLGSLGWRRIADSFAYQSSFASTFDAHYVLARAAEVLPRSPSVALVLLSAIGVGVFRRRIPLAVAAVLDSLLMVSTLRGPPALFTASHDTVMIAVLAGVGLLGGLRRSADRRTKLLAVLYVVSWFGGLGMAATATYGLYKLPVGAVFAAIIVVIAVADRCVATGRPRLAPVQALVLLAVILTSSLQSYYGEPPMPKNASRVRIVGGPYAGLAVPPNEERLIEIARDALRQQQRPGDTIAVLGPLPGFYLLSEARVRAMSQYPLSPLVQPSGLAVTHAYYSKLENRPSLVLVYREPRSPIVNPFDPEFAAWYRLRQRYATPKGMIEIFRRADEQPG